MSTHADVLTEAWETGSVTRQVDNGRGIDTLVTAKALVPFDAGYVLSSDLKHHFDLVAQRNRTYAAGSDVRALLDAALEQASSISDAMLESRFEDAEIHGRGFLEAASDLHQAFEGSVRQLKAVTDMRYGDVPSISDKRRQNRYFERRQRAISEALDMITSSEKVEETFSRSELQEQRDLYRRLVVVPANRHLGTLLAIAKTIGENLFRLRRVGEAFKRMKQLRLHMERNPEWRPPEPMADDIPRNPWMLIADPIEIVSYPDVGAIDAEEGLSTTAAGLKGPGEASCKSTRPKGVMEKDAYETTEIVIEDDPMIIQYDLMTDQGFRTPTSAREWHSSKRIEQPLDLWLLFVHGQAEHDGTDTGCRASHIYRPHERSEGTLMLVDVILEPA